MANEPSALTDDEIAHSIRLTEHQLLRRDQLAREEAQRAAEAAALADPDAEPPKRRRARR